MSRRVPLATELQKQDVNILHYIKIAPKWRLIKKDNSIERLKGPLKPKLVVLYTSVSRDKLSFKINISLSLT